jgi:hypothetical protein
MVRPIAIARNVLSCLKRGWEQGFGSHRYVIIFKVIQSFHSTKNAGDSIGLSATAAPENDPRMLKIYNSLKREKQLFIPIEPNKVRMYVCGMTVYDYCHLGHARVMVVFDMVYRWLKASGYDVTYVRNITDIDDKIIKRAAENGETIQQLTNRFIAFMHEDADALGVLRPDLSRGPPSLCRKCSI